MLITSYVRICRIVIGDLIFYRGSPTIINIHVGANESAGELRCVLFLVQLYEPSGEWNTTLKATISKYIKTTNSG